MPIPQRHSREQEQDFVSRCIGELVSSGEYEQDQSSAICYQQRDVQLMNNKEWRREFVSSADNKVKQLYKNSL
jgi:hypothetical protein